MDSKQMTAPCGLDCFNCVGYLANENPDMIGLLAATLAITPEDAKKAVCKGCRNQNGNIPFAPMKCHVYPCAEKKNVSFCYECSDFPCDYLHPYADQAAKVPHNTKVFNLCLIKKLGLEAWAKDKAKSVKEKYFKDNWKL
jgi:hypothetical protein